MNMYIAKVVDYVDFGGVETTNIGIFLTEENAAEYCNKENSIKNAIDEKKKIIINK